MNDEIKTTDATTNATGDSPAQPAKPPKPRIEPESTISPLAAGQWLSIADVAKLIDVSERTVGKYLAYGCNGFGLPRRWFAGRIQIHERDLETFLLSVGTTRKRSGPPRGTKRKSKTDDAAVAPSAAQCGDAATADGSNS